MGDTRTWHFVSVAGGETRTHTETDGPIDHGCHSWARRPRKFARESLRRRKEPVAMALVAHYPLVPAQSRPRIQTACWAAGTPTIGPAEKSAVSASGRQRKYYWYNLKYNLYFSQNMPHCLCLIPC